MTAALTRVSRIFAAAALAAFSSAAPALAEPLPSPTAKPSGPVAMPYPNSPESGQAAGTVYSSDRQEGGEIAAHKHIGNPKYSDVARADAVSAASEAQVIEVQSISWGKVGDAGTVYSADPMEGGQIAARTRPGKPTYGNMAITKQMDAASPKMMSAAPASSDEPGKLEYPNAQGAGVAAKTTATFTTLAGKCVKGKHLDKVTITTRSASYTLRDAVVTNVTPAGDGMETVSLTYASMGD